MIRESRYLSQHAWKMRHLFVFPARKWMGTSQVRCVIRYYRDSLIIIFGCPARRARERRGGRPVVNVTHGKPMIALKMYEGGSADIAEICKSMHISRATLSRWKKL